MQLKVGEEGREGIGIMPLRDLSCMVGYAETIGGGSEWPWDDSFEQTGLMQARHRNGLPTSLTEEEGDFVGLRQETPNRNSRGITLGDRMGTKNRERVPVVTLDELFELIDRQARHMRSPLSS
jgi:hypothetical protein